MQPCFSQRGHKNVICLNAQQVITINWCPYHHNNEVQNKIHIIKNSFVTVKTAIPYLIYVFGEEQDLQKFH